MTKTEDNADNQKQVKKMNLQRRLITCTQNMNMQTYDMQIMWKFQKLCTCRSN